MDVRSGIGTTTTILPAFCTAAAESSLTIYNRNFAVGRESAPLDLQRGTNEVRVTQITAHLEPDSVILRDPQGQRALQILEQNHRADPISQGLLPSLYEGKETGSVEIRVVEHLYRWINWKIVENSDPFTKTDSQTIDFRVPVPAGQEKVVTYRIHHTW